MRDVSKFWNQNRIENWKWNQYQLSKFPRNLFFENHFSSLFLRSLFFGKNHSEHWMKCFIQPFNSILFPSISGSPPLKSPQTSFIKRNNRFNFCFICFYWFNKFPKNHFSLKKERKVEIDTTQVNSRAKVNLTQSTNLKSHWKSFRGVV